VERFLEHLGRPADPAIVGPALEVGLLAAHAAWPEVPLEEGAILRYLAERLASEEDPAAALAVLEVPDLYLCCACAAGVPQALAALDERYVRPLDRTLLRLGLTGAEAADALQQALQALLVGTERAPPALSRYAGRGPLRSFVRIIAVRAARKVRERQRGEVEEDEPLLDALPGAQDDPELNHLKRSYREEFRAAFHEALQGLPAEDLLLLRQHVVEGLGIDQLAGLHGVHRATAARRLARVREALANDTRRCFLRRVPLDQAGYQSILRLIQSQLDLSIRSHLKG
jgi:RNA polymerase sigma-70 factor (ECF subfamily)